MVLRIMGSITHSGRYTNTNRNENTMREHRDTAPTPTSLRREQQPRNKRVRRVPVWRDEKRVNEWCGWRMSVTRAQGEQQ